ncbi:MAG: DUF4432 family protein [Alphaproteobacteria bacterium]|jgi:hypothetical protein|nr:DUF4432 family protein [Alphaproteobacteria bacterium]MBU1550514.1 DUF4432 family protein [Alphaproteobacteria bacterium]MBU2338650.1 DUF4432 family protein [Alphaproteobacteria bacterium]MBU2386741.1 DUF4432 family protein [Alphaproteobacteria bacterium]
MKAFSAAVGPRLMLDESSVLDIGSCFVGEVDLAPGRAIPDDGDPRIDHSLEGFLFTCGPDHIRHPEPIPGRKDGKHFPLHGSFSSHPAKLVFWDGQGEDVECHAEVPVKLADGGTALLERQWRIDGQSGEVWLADKVTNTGPEPFSPVHMYHMNIGAWLFDSAVRLNGAMLENGSLPWNFGEDPGGVFCVPAATEGAAWAEVNLGPIAAIGGKTLRVKFRTDTLPHLQIWRNQQSPAHVLGIEPVSHRWVDRRELEEAGELSLLGPGESIDYGLRFCFV